MIPKFRAWDKTHKKLGLIEADMVNGTFQSVKIFDEDDDDWQVFDNFILMQSTGIKDRNGVEIFEGDMFKDGVVEYDVELGMWIVSFFKFDNYMKLSNYLRDFKGSVIGNIYENPDLVEEQ